MAKKNIFDVILKTINDVQTKNKANPNEQTAEANVFDLIKNKIQQLDEKSKAKRVSKGKSPHSILDLIKKEINGARRENKKDPNVQTAPGSIFDRIIKKVDERPRRQASAGIRKIAQDYNLDINRLPQNIVQQLQQKYQADRHAFDKQYAQAMHDMLKKMK